MVECKGDQSDHCCYIGGKVCQYLEENTMPGRHWVCGLLRKLGSWEAVESDPGYQTNVKPELECVGISSCQSWPRPNETCAVCGVTG